MNNFLEFIILNNTVRDWIISLSIILGVIIVLRLFQSLIINKVRSLTAKTKTTIDDFIISTMQSSVMPLLYVLAFYFGLQYLMFSAKAESVIHIALMFAITFFILKIISSFIAYVFRQALLKQGRTAQREKQSRGILLIVQIVIWLIGLLFLIDNLGYDITTVVAGLGIGGIAIALAAQTILGDLFSYFVIFFDKPFEIGDFIIVDDKMGTVEYVGIKTTRIRTLGGEQLVCSNTDLTNSRVHNYKRMQERRVVFSFGVVYSTEAGKLALIPQQVKKIIEGLPDTRFDRAHFKDFGDFSLNFEVVYYVLSADYNVYMDRQQTVNLKIFELLGKEQVEFAFPTQTVFLNDMHASRQESNGKLLNHK
ncbi:MAG: mechanosensitive ion channel family protein [Chitinophagaceae bacterium]